MEHQNKNNKKSRVSAPSDPEYGPDDILLGRSSTCYKHPGNVRFRRIIAANAEMYIKHKYSSREKIKLVHCLIGLLQSSGGQFLRYEHDRWCEVSMRQVREKVGHALRDAYTCQEVAKRKGGAQTNRKSKVSTSGDQYQPNNAHHTPCVPQHLVPDDTRILALNKGRDKNSLVPCVRSVLPPSLNNICLPPSPPPFVSFNPLQSSPGVAGGLLVNITGQQDLPPQIARHFHTAAALTTRPLATQLLPQQCAAQQLHQMEKHYLRANIEQTTPSLLHEVGESMRQPPHHLTRQQQALSDPPHKTRTAALTNNERIVSLPPSWSNTSPPLPFASSNPIGGSSDFMRGLSLNMPGQHALPPMVPAALPTQPSERQIPSQQQQLHHQMVLQCNNLRTNIDQTVSLLREVGELTREHQQQLSRQHRDLAEQLHEQQKKADVPPVLDKKRVPSPWGAQDEPSISIKVANKHKPLDEILRADTHDSKSNKKRNLSQSLTNSVEEESEKESADIVRRYDVLPGTRKHFGNALYRSLVAQHGPRYNKGDVKQDRIKEEIVACILDTIHGHGGRFLTVDPIRREFCQQSRIGAKKRVMQALLAERYSTESRDTRKGTSPPSPFHAATSTTTRLETVFRFAGNESNLPPEYPSSDAPEQHQEDNELAKRYQHQLCQEQQHTLLKQLQAQQTTTVAPSASSKKCVSLPWEDQEPSLSIKVCTKKQATGVHCSLQRTRKKSPKKRITSQLHHPIPDVISSRSNQEAVSSAIFCHISEDEGDGSNDEYEDVVMVEMIESAYEQIGNR